MDRDLHSESAANETSEVRRYFELLVPQAASARAAELARLEREDSALAREVGRLLRAHDERGHFLSQAANIEFDDKAQPPLEAAGPYRLTRLLGEGGMGVVYEAHRADDTFRKRVALKMIRASLLTPALKERFRVERQILAAMEHPNVARILDGGTASDGSPYLVMEYVEGVRIDEHANRNDLGLEARLQLVLQACDAVQFAHRHLVVHRDLKPANILVTEAGQVKLLDFGIAKILSHRPELGLDAQATAAYPMTPDYASPEQVKGQPITTATDQFLMGIVLYEMAAGVHPFSHAGARRPHELMASVCENDAPPPSAVARFAWKSRLRGDFDKIVETAMHRQPERRYASVEALAADLRRFLSKEPVAARGDGLGYRAGKFLRRRWLPLAAAAAVFASLAAAAMLSAASAREARQQRALAEARRVEAEQQRKFAEEAAQAARMQQAAAEARRVEAERLRLAADAERARSQRNMEAQRALSLNLLSSSDTQFRAGNFQDAIANLERNLEAQRSLARADPGDPHLAKIIGALEVRLCAMRASSGDPKGAVAECKAAIERLAPFAGGGDDLVLASLGAAYSTYGKLKTNPKEAGEAVSHGRKAVQTYEALLAWQPKNPQHQRSLALSRAYLAQGLFMAGDKRQSVATFGQAVDSLQTLIHTNPADTKAVLGFASMLAMQSNMLFKAGDTNEARAAMRHALSLFQALAEAPGATDLEQNEYANWLVRSEFSELWQPGTAIRFAQRAVRSSEERNPGYLDTLAWAYYRNGDVRAAVEAQRKALRVIEANATFLRMPALKKEIEDGLSVFEEALQKK